jgi:D-glycero-D-manno-heptose 1,7-bisphosphate phosphatase
LRHEAVFLDRDGVLIRTFVRNGVPHPPAGLKEMEILPGVPAALAQLAAAHFKLIVVSNQPDVARGTQSRAIIEAMNGALQSALPLDGVYVCFHDDGDGCDCRKPAPGLLQTAAREHDIDLERSFMIGDRWSDIVAGVRAGCRTLLVDREYSQRHRCNPDWVIADVSEAARRIIAVARPDRT